MSQGGFVVAMAATISVARYEKPYEILRPVKRWTIVSRFGPESEYLTISAADLIRNEEITPPMGLAPARTALGILLSEGPQEAESVFLLVRRLPPGVNVAGTFFPAEGYAALRGAFDKLHLRVGGRHAHSRGLENAQDVRKDIPDPAPGAKWAMAWHIEAVQRPWVGEFFASERRPGVGPTHRN